MRHFERCVTKTAPIRPGTLALIVGPSGAGKDALLDAARTALEGDRRFKFARRIITRAAHETSEVHDVMGADAFDAAEAAGEFLLSWRAHGLGYAIPGSAGDELRAANVVVANVSRTSIATAERLVERVVVIHVTAPLEVLARRIAARGREPEQEIAARLARQVPLATAQAQIIEIDNGGRLEDAAWQLIAALRRLAEPIRESGR